MYIPEPRRDGAGDFHSAGGAARDGMATMTAGRAAGDRSGASSMSAVAARLAGHRLKVTPPQRPEGHTLTITGAGQLRCTLALDDDGTGCEASIAPGRDTTPALIAPLVARLLGAGYPDPARHAGLHRGTTLAGAVARDLAARGLHARMDVIEDHDSYHAFADVIITNPAKRERGRVHLGDDGWVSWECCADELPGGPGGLADTLAAALTQISPPVLSWTARLRRGARRPARRLFPRLPRRGG
jgi:hypothetical protein